MKSTTQEIAILFCLLALPFLGMAEEVNPKITSVKIMDCNVTVNPSGQANPSCLDPNAGANGWASVTGSNGTAPYTYLWNDALSQTTSTATGLSAGSYTVTVEDALGCTASAAVNLQDLSLSISWVQNIACMGQNTGNTSAVANGGNPPYTWVWSNGGTYNNDNNLSAGSYSVTVTDNNGCTATTSVVITQPATLLTASIASSTNLTCNGFNTGTATVTASGGNAPYNYNWNPSGQNTATATGLWTNTFTVYVTDANGCNMTASVNITQPANLSISITNNNTCNGGATGNATASVTGGTSPYTYSWNTGGQTTATATGLSAGNYTLTVTDNNGCSANFVTNINSYASFYAYSAQNSNISCNGGTNGGAYAWNSGGYTPFSYLWSNSQTNTTATGLSAGTYTVTITNSVGCTATSSVNITQPAALNLTVTKNNVTCHSGGNGNATVSVSGGVVPYTYSWTNGGINSTDYGLTAGSYTVTVTDWNGCTATASVIITQPTTLIAAISDHSSETCNGLNNGSASVVAANGTSPYTYSWSPPYHTTAFATGLSPGNYTVYVTDNNGCVATASVNIGMISSPVATIGTARNLTCAGSNNGMAVVLPSNGIPSYTYSWSPSGQTHAIATGLSAGTYTAEITDELGCTATASVNVTQPMPITVNVYNYSSLAYALVSGGTPPFTYSWTPAISTTALATGVGPGSYTVFVSDSNSCVDSAIINLTSNMKIPNDSLLRYPRWSKRGMYLEHACTYAYYNNTDSITKIVNYVRANHITYVLMDGLDYESPSSCVFDTGSARVYGPNAISLENFIDSLKTRGNVDQVGVVCYKSTTSNLDSAAYSVKNYDVQNFADALNTYNTGLPWVKKIDVLSLDEEFWGHYKKSDPPAIQWDSTVRDFKNVHLPMLKSMWKAAHKCDHNFIRVEDYIEPPLNPADTTNDTKTEKMEIDSICKYTDRILLSTYTSHNILWTWDRYVWAYNEIAKNPTHSYFKKEVWPVFSAENATDTLCPYETSSSDYSGYYMCDNNITSDALEQLYYDSLCPSMEHHWWLDGDSNYHPFKMGADTCFKVEGNMWWEYSSIKNYPFNTNVITGAIHFYVTVGHDIQWNGSPVTLTATVHGGSYPYWYVWYDEDNHDAVLQSDTTRTYVTNFPSRISVLAVDVNLNTATDYLSVYDDTCFTLVASVKNLDGNFKIYPNPSDGIFTVESSEVRGQWSIDVYNIFGEKIKSEELRENREELDLSGQAAGVYFCRIKDEKGNLLKSSKIIVIH